MPFHRRRVRGGLGRAIYSIRRRLNLSQIELASRIACDQTAISLYESGRSKPGAARLISLLKHAAVPREQTPILRELEPFGLHAEDFAFLNASGSTDTVSRVFADRQMSNCEPVSDAPDAPTEEHGCA